MCIYRAVRKCGAFHIPIKKNRISHILFVEKMGLIIYLAALKKGAGPLGTHIRTMPYIGNYPTRSRTVFGQTEMQFSM